MKKYKFFLATISIVAVVFIMIEVIIVFNLNRSLFYGGVIRFGPMALGGEMIGGPGSDTFAPQLIIPSSKNFYIEVVQENLWCVFEECSSEGQVVYILNGWLQGENIEQPTIKNDYGLRENEKVKSLVIVGDKYGRIVGIYPNKTIDDLLSILQIHHNLWTK